MFYPRQCQNKLEEADIWFWPLRNTVYRRRLWCTTKHAHPLSISVLLGIYLLDDFIHCMYTYPLLDPWLRPLWGSCFSSLWASSCWSLGRLGPVLSLKRCWSFHQCLSKWHRYLHISRVFKSCRAVNTSWFWKWFVGEKKWLQPYNFL